MCVFFLCVCGCFLLLFFVVVFLLLFFFCFVFCCCFFFFFFLFFFFFFCLVCFLLAIRNLSQGIKNKLESAMVNEPSVFELLNNISF